MAAAPGRPKPGQPPWGAVQYAKRQAWGPMAAAPGRPKPGQPPWGAVQYAKRQAWGPMAAAPGRPKPGQPPWGAVQYAKRQAWGPMAAAPGRPKPGQPPRGAAQYAKRQAWGPQHASEATTSVSCCPGGTCCLARPISNCVTPRQACAIRSSRGQTAGFVSTATASGRSNGWGCGGCWARAEAVPQAAIPGRQSIAGMLRA